MTDITSKLEEGDQVRFISVDVDAEKTHDAEPLKVKIGKVTYFHTTYKNGEIYLITPAELTEAEKEANAKESGASVSLYSGRDGPMDKKGAY